MDTRVCRLHGQGDIRIERQSIAGPGPGEALVAVSVGGICGSDLHYFQDDGFGPIRVHEPIILGHEAAGTVLEIGRDCSAVNPGDRVAINPSRPCGVCRYCRDGLRIHCLAMRFSGSAIRMPHKQGLLRDRILLDAAQCVPVGSTVSLAEAACAEPLAVCLHACAAAGPLESKRVLVTGAGPIGALCAGVAAEAGAAAVVVTDLCDFPLDVARRMGANETVNVSATSDAMVRFEADKGWFDMAFECSAAGPAIRTAITCLRPRGVLVQVGVAGDTTVPLSFLVRKKITRIGSQRFDSEFIQAVAMVAERRIDVAQILTGCFPLECVVETFAAATDRTSAVKTQLEFERFG